MIHRTGLKVALPATALFVLAAWIGFCIGRPREPDLGVDLNDGFIVLEEGSFLVPEGKMAVFTALGSRLGSITEMGIKADGEELARAWGSGTADRTLPVLALAQAGQRIKIFGGLIRGDDVFALGYLRPQPGSAGDPSLRPPGLHSSDD